jgi:hypothetical protein
MAGVRTFAVALVVAWHALAGGIGSLLHTCSMSPEMAVAACKCPHAQATAGAGDQLRRSDCCKEELVRAQIAPAIRESARGVEALASPALPAVAIAPVDPNIVSSQVRAWRTSAPAHGPPVFLKTRMLLI